MFVEVFILNRHGGLFNVVGDFRAFNHKTIVFGSCVFPEDISVSVEVFVHGFGNGDVREFNVGDIFLKIEEKTADGDNSEKNTSSEDFSDGF